MPPISNRYRRSPSPASQDSFGGPVSQDPEAQYLAATKAFHVPLSDLGGTPTQEIIHDDADAEPPLSDASEHHAFLDSAMTDYEARKADRAVGSSATGKVLVAATPSESAGSSSGVYSRRNEDQFLKKGGAEQDSQESTQPFDFDLTASSFDRLLDKEAEKRSKKPAVELAPTQPTVSGYTDTSLRAEPPTSGEQGRRRPPSPQWLAPTPDAAVASSNPRSLLRLVNPENKYRIAKLRQMHGDVAPPSYVGNSVGAETQPAGIEETQPSTQAQPDLSYRDAIDPQTRGHRNKVVDPMEVVPDSEPLRVGHGAVVQNQTRASLPRDLTIDDPSCNVPPAPSKVEEPSTEDEDDADVPLSTKLSAKAAGKAPAAQSKARSGNSRKPKSVPVSTRNVCRSCTIIFSIQYLIPSGPQNSRRSRKSSEREGSDSG